ncbi:MAG: hypothetical protein ACJ752_14125 [Gaiellaceae bacterium]
MTTEGQQPEEVEPILQRGGLVHDAALIGVMTVANHGLGPLVEQGVEWVQDQLKHDPPPQIERPPGYDHDR